MCRCMRSGSIAQTEECEKKVEKAGEDPVTEADPAEIETAVNQITGETAKAAKATAKKED